MKAIFKKPYLYWFIAIFILYLIVNLLVSGFYDTIPLIIVNAKTVSWFKLSISLVLSLAIGFFVAVNLIYIYMIYKQRKTCKAGMTTTSLGTLGGLITGFCPVCITGLFPLILGFLGISFSLASLPFQGIEIQFGVLLLLVFSYMIIEKEVEYS